MTSIKKLVGKSPDRGRKIQDALEASQFVASEVSCLCVEVSVSYAGIIPVHVT